MKDHKKIIVLVSLILIISLVLYSSIYFISKINKPTDARTIETVQFPSAILSGTTSEGDVAIELAPIEIKDNQLYISISANTHSVDLSQFNLKDIINLEYNNYNLKPISVPELSGHHSSGELIFNVSDIDKFTIKINSIPKIEQRVFRWVLDENKNFKEIKG